MSSKYQMYLMQSDKFKFPVLPDEVTVSYPSGNTKMRVYGIGEVTIIQDSDAAVIEFSCFFPKTYFPGCVYKNIPDPNDAVDTIIAMRDSKKASRFTITGGIGISMYVTIESFEISEKGGDPGTILYSIKLKEYRKVTMRQLKIDSAANKVVLTKPAARLNIKKAPDKYIVKPGDCLYNIALSCYGDGSKYSVIYRQNKSIIGPNPNLIRPGQTLLLSEI